MQGSGQGQMTLYSGNSVQVERKFSDFAILHRCTSMPRDQAPEDFQQWVETSSLLSGLLSVFTIFCTLCVPELPYPQEMKTHYPYL